MVGGEETGSDPKEVNSFLSQKNTKQESQRRREDTRSGSRRQSRSPVSVAPSQRQLGSLPQRWAVSPKPLHFTSTMKRSCSIW